MTLLAVDHVGLSVGDAVQAAHYFRSAYGFHIEAETGPGAGPDGTRSFVLRHGDVRLMVTSSLNGNGPTADFVRRHGDGVRDVAFSSTDAVGDFERAVAAGAEAVQEPVVHEDESGRVTVAVIGTDSDLVHSLVQRDNPDGSFLPGVHRPVPHQGGSAGPAGDATAHHLHTVDHLALCLRPDTLDRSVSFYERALGLRHTYDETIVVGGQTMNSKVVQNDSRRITFTMVEPRTDGPRGQLHDFLDNFGGPGVQHIAFGTDAIADAVRALAVRGVDFLSTPSAYYTALAERGIDVGMETETLRELSLLVDRDDWGHLIQIFTRSPYARRTLFFELIQRVEARTFGSGNIKALYEAVERERTRTGADETGTGTDTAAPALAGTAQA
ncbi:4-hydroxyphenylpyruvate dioxygenase [Streptomyces sp. ET3-23]|uniref:4-hydroxyphenylpyruvate dioxygenase n=1 Tax=Streptomyces sp. ET3-23 TaxID=2885643 RepID=UPI001D10C92E|nr:4-hydroxyphenylpyruvate dioxygenase [Streptomyces sp. ET3-23]MCC2280476.1 4-hydroxyphenylpyruvate dioxygenase [Streptomyces sp. ET3-23]